ncbi:MAG: winged helix-turn-helix transcriptional regulator [Phycisphaerales bacterium]|nr:MAG: winged helix-turn-helix transcriptional regulator [Phycisphaerales bacterium]
MDKELATYAADVLRAVAHPLRLQVIELLEKGEMCVGAISEALGEKQAITSQQLNIMKNRGILTSRREGTKVFYRLENRNVTQVLNCVYNHCQARARKGQQ